MQTIEQPNKQIATFEPQPIVFTETVERLTEIAKECMSLTVKDVSDKAGFEAVHKARMQLVKLGGNIEKQRIELKEPSLKHGRDVDGVAKTLAAIIAPAKKHLEEQEAIVAREKKRIADEEAALRQKMIRARLESLQQCGVVAMESDVANLTSGEWAVLIQAKQREKKERDDKAAAEEAERQKVAAEQKAEADKLAAERAWIDRVKREQAEAQAKIDADKRKIEEELTAKQRNRDPEVSRQTETSNIATVVPRPQLVSEINWSPLLSTILEGMKYTAELGYEDDDFPHYVYESAMTCAYGDSYFAWKRKLGQ